MHKKRCIVAVLLMASLAASASGETSKPAEVTGQIHASEPYGQGTYSYAFFTVYDVSLWTDASPWSIDAPFALSLRYHMHFTSQEIVQRSIDEMMKQDLISQTTQKPYYDALSQVIPEVHAGDVITDMYIPGKGSIFYFNGHKMGQISNDTYARNFLSIWLSEKTSAPKLRNALIKGESK